MLLSRPVLLTGMRHAPFHDTSVRCVRRRRRFLRHASGCRGQTVSVWRGGNQPTFRRRQTCRSHQCLPGHFESRCHDLETLAIFKITHPQPHSFRPISMNQSSFAFNRRHFFRTSSTGVGVAALARLLGTEGGAAAQAATGGLPDGTHFAVASSKMRLQYRAVLSCFATSGENKL